MSSDAVLERLLHLHPKLIDLSLERTVDLLERLGNPQDRLPPVVHVAGTNGKGSTLAILRAIAEAAGYRVHCYTSPHLVRFHERIRLAGSLISERELSALLEACEAVNEGHPITFFEITTCAAFKAMAETPADLVLLETGLGGRLDSTNVVKKPVATAITPVSLDHMQFLGPNIAAIAGEKAAIQKAGVPSVVAPQHPDALSVIERVAVEVGAPQFQPARDFSIEETEGGVRFRWRDETYDLPRPHLTGAHQVVNSGTALALAMILRQNGFKISDDALAEGLRRVSWPARLHVLQHGPIVDALVGWEVVLDGGHNQAAGAALSDALSQWAQADIAEFGVARPVYAVCGMLTSKAAMDFLTPLAPFLSGFSAVTIPDEENSIPGIELARMAQMAGVRHVSVSPSIEDAATRIQATRPQGRFLIIGSLYLAGHVLRTHR